MPCVTVHMNDWPMPFNDPDVRRAYQRAYQRQWYLKTYVDQVKAQPCLDCGGRYPPFVMDFDHVRGDRVDAVSRFRAGRLARARLEAELAKCEVVCANCHRRRT